MASKNSARSIISSVIKLLLTAAIIAVLIRNLGWDTIVSTVRGADPLWLLAGAVVFLISGWLGVVQWRVILENRGLSLPFWRAFKLYFVGLFFNNFIMGGIVGDAVKVASIHSRDGKGITGFAATFLDRFAGLWALCGFAVAGSFILLNRGMLTHGNIGTAVTALFCAFILFAGIMLFLVFKPLQTLFFSITERIPLCRKFKIKEIVSQVLIEAGDVKLMSSVALLALLTQFLRIGSNILIAASLGLVTAANFQYFFIFIPIIAMLMTVPLPFGAREAFGGVLFSMAGFQREAAFIMGFLASVIAIAVSSLGGVFFVTEKISEAGNKNDPSANTADSRARAAALAPQSKAKRLLRAVQQIIWPLIPLPLGLKRVIWHKLFFNKESFVYKDSRHGDVFSKIYGDNFWLSKESRSGGGSLISTTKTIREKLPVLWKEYGIKTFLDVPCGDYNWMKEVDKSGITYTGGDIVGDVITENNKKYSAQNVSFKVIDITKDGIEAVDMIFCKDCLQHLSYEKIFMALRNFKKSKSKYLLTTSYCETLYNWDIHDGDCRPLNLLKKPFSLPPPLMKIREKSRGVQVDSDKEMYLYKLEDINDF